MYRFVAVFAFGATVAAADPAVIEDVTADQTGSAWRFSVTLSHGDTGWDDYADGWRIVDPDTGEVYGTRELLHPHVTEQPFTRSLSGVMIPDGVKAVAIEERTNQTEWGQGDRATVSLSD